MIVDYKQILNNPIGVAVDYGSTTIALSVLDSFGNELASTSYPNPQRSFGQDVITRIKRCLDDKSLSDQAYQEGREQLFSAITQLNISLDDISTIVISGNSIMQHLFQNLSVEGFAHAPFYTVNNNYHEENIFVFPPGFSPYVGADIVCGANYLNLGNRPEYDLMIDLGTNGEIVLINKDKGFVTSTACGPVFDYAIGGARYGSECIHAIAQCIQHNLIDSTGKIVDAFFDHGIIIDTNFVIKQNNVRNFQLAKGAIIAGITCLLDFAQIDDSAIRDVYVCGGLGFYMNIRDAYTLKMLPNSFRNRVKICGNTSLEGAKLLAKAVLQKKNGNSTEYNNILTNYDDLRNKTRALNLSDLSSFQEIYLNSLNF